MHIVVPLKTQIYFLQVFMLFVGSMVLAFGVFLETKADLLYVPGEGVVKAYVIKAKKKFGKTKVFFDLFLCILAILLSLVFLQSIQGLREGTIFSAILVGNFVRLYNKILCHAKS